MSDDISPLNDNARPLTKSEILTFLNTKLARLEESDRTIIVKGPVALGLNAGLAGMIANSFFRRALNVTQGRIVSNLPMAVLPFITTAALYNAVVSYPLLSGDLNCPTCVLTRGALVAVFGGGIYPALLALPVNAGLAARYNTAPLPEKGNVMRFWVNLSRPIIRKMGAVLLLQTFFGTYLSSKFFDIYLKMIQSPESEEVLN